MALRRAFQGCLLLIVAWPQVASVPSWLAATWIGCVWGTLALTGMFATWTRYRIAWIGYAMLVMALAHRGLMNTLALEHHQSWLVVCGLVAGGWLIGKLTTASSAADQRIASEVMRWPQLSLWDLVTVTTSVALFCSILPRVDGFFYLACHLLPALSGGLLLSLLAAQWAWRDRWTISSMLGALAVALIAILLIVPYTSFDSQALLTLAVWMVVGPIGVIVAQGTLVLAYMALARA